MAISRQRQNCYCQESRYSLSFASFVTSRIRLIQFRLTTLSQSRYITRRVWQFFSSSSVHITCPLLENKTICLVLSYVITQLCIRINLELSHASVRQEFKVEQDVRNDEQESTDRVLKNIYFIENHCQTNISKGLNLILCS